MHRCSSGNPSHHPRWVVHVREHSSTVGQTARLYFLITHQKRNDINKNICCSCTKMTHEDAEKRDSHLRIEKKGGGFYLQEAHITQIQMLFLHHCSTCPKLLLTTPKFTKVSTYHIMLQIQPVFELAL